MYFPDVCYNTRLLKSIPYPLSSQTILDSERLHTWVRFYYQVPERWNPCSPGSGKYQGQDTNPSMCCRGAPAAVSRALTVITTVTRIVCPTGVSGSVLGASHMPLAWPSRQPCEGGVFTSKLQLGKRRTEPVEKEAAFGPPSMRSLGSHELSSSGTPGPGKRTGDVGHLGHDSYSPEAGHPDEFQISATPAVPTAVPRQGCLSAASKYGPKSDTSPSSNQVTSPRVSFSHKVK